MLYQLGISLDFASAETRSDLPRSEQLILSSAKTNHAYKTSPDKANKYDLQLLWVSHLGTGQVHRQRNDCMGKKTVRGRVETSHLQ